MISGLGEGSAVGDGLISSFLGKRAINPRYPRAKAPIVTAKIKKIDSQGFFFSPELGLITTVGETVGFGGVEDFNRGLWGETAIVGWVDKSGDISPKAANISLAVANRSRG
jgi:hypothetical protein